MKLFLTKQAQKEYFKLTQSDQKKVVRKINELEKDPFVGKKLGGELDKLRSLRSWPYRIIYYIKQNKKEVWVEHIIHRQGAYK